MPGILPEQPGNGLTWGTHWSALGSPGRGLGPGRLTLSPLAPSGTGPMPNPVLSSKCGEFEAPEQRGPPPKGRGCHREVFV